MDKLKNPILCRVVITFNLDGRRTQDELDKAGEGFLYGEALAVAEIFKGSANVELVEIKKFHGEGKK